VCQPWAIRWIGDYPTDLVPTAQTLVCDKCKAWTWWASPRQKKSGRCWDCVPGVSFWRSTPEHETRVIKLLLAAFPGAEISRYVRPRYHRGEYRGREAGPCTRCRHRVRVYGPDGHRFCLECQPRNEEDS